MDEEEQQEAPQPAAPTPNPQLADFVGSFQTDAGQDWAAKAAARVQAHMDIQAAAQAQDDARQQFIGNLAQTKQNLVGLARSQPTSADLALDLADITMQGLTEAHGQSPEAHVALLGHMQEEIAHAAIQGYAGLDENTARQKLNDSRLTGLIPDDQKAALDTYISNMANLRRVDDSARQQEIARQHMMASGQGAREWLSGLTEPTTGQLWFPDNWGQRMLADPRISPDDKAGLHRAYQNLLANGDPQTSDPYVVTDLLRRSALPPQDPDHPMAGDVLAHVGDALSLADAQFVGSKIGPQPAAARAGTQKLVDAMDDAEAQIGNRNAYGRFVDWFLPAARNGGSLDPGSKDYLLTPERMARFQPNGDDVIGPAVQVAADDRPSLFDIFAGKRRPSQEVPIKPMFPNGGYDPNSLAPFKRLPETA
jgi:hypothetical protein